MRIRSLAAVALALSAVVGCTERRDAVPAPALAAAAAAAGPPRFEEATDVLGVDFVRFDGRDPGPGGLIEGGRRMFEWTGGGVAAFDHDADGRPDLFFTQGREWGDGNDPPDSTPDSTPDPAADRRDRLYRNVDGARFADVTADARLVSTGFGHGAAAGDYNGDGFADLYVANAGENRLLRNNGDGTFSDVTAEADIEGSAWTLSAAVADLNGDGLPDLYDANYLEGPEVFTLICAADGQLPRVCNPNVFAAARDRLLLNLGNGRFGDVSEDAGFTEPGPGMGVVVTDLDGRPGNEIFVANDQRPNQFYVRDDDGSRKIPRYLERALSAGVATGGAGSADNEACMGVALGDADGDGRPDLFVTNFAEQSNTLYRSASAAGEELFFEDETRPAGLFEPGFDTLGFGTQFLDHDLNGTPDLVLVNGHLDDFTHNETPFRMKPLLLDNVGDRFEPVPAAVAGEYFERPNLGRSLARLDWDGDGREEFAVSHMNGPAAVLHNVVDAGTGVTLRLVGTAGDRDAVGAAVTVTAPTAAGAPSGPNARWVAAGDGYAAGNERQLVFGLGDTPPGAPLAVRVRWPGGTEETFAGVTAGGRFVLVQGRGTATETP